MTPAEAWVEQVAGRTRPDRVVWCDGSEQESDRLRGEMLADGTLIELNQKQAPGCTLHRSDPGDVARVEHLTFICSDEKEDAGPTNNWMLPREAREERVGPLFDGVMKGRTMYVVPYVIGARRLALQQGRHRGHRQPVRRREHESDDPDGAAGHGSARRER